MERKNRLGDHESGARRSELSGAGRMEAAGPSSLAAPGLDQIWSELDPPETNLEAELTPALLAFIVNDPRAPTVPAVPLTALDGLKKQHASASVRAHWIETPSSMSRVAGKRLALLRAFRLDEEEGVLRFRTCRNRADLAPLLAPSLLVAAPRSGNNLQGALHVQREITVWLIKAYREAHTDALAAELLSSRREKAQERRRNRRRSSDESGAADPAVGSSLVASLGLGTSISIPGGAAGAAGLSSATETMTETEAESATEASCTSASASEGESAPARAKKKSRRERERERKERKRCVGGRILPTECARDPFLTPCGGHSSCRVAEGDNTDSASVASFTGLQLGGPRSIEEVGDLRLRLVRRRGLLGL